MSADPKPAEVTFVDIPPEAAGDLPDAGGIGRAVGRGRGHGGCLVEASAVVIKVVAKPKGSAPVFVNVVNGVELAASIPAYA